MNASENSKENNHQKSFYNQYRIAYLEIYFIYIYLYSILLVIFTKSGNVSIEPLLHDNFLPELICISKIYSNHFILKSIDSVWDLDLNSDLAST